mmetsp:Transcript_81306/g.242292  ORF Transcript_81306/g.242292 Transcript_81306/m.242292 type:complete len:317 (-) Transcript_81306:1766-2716(-)
MAAAPCTPPNVIGIRERRRMKARTCSGCSIFNSHGLCPAAMDRSCIAPSKSCSPSKTDRSSSSALQEAARRRCSHCWSDSEVCMLGRGSSHGLSRARHGLAQSRSASREPLRRWVASALSPQVVRAVRGRPEEWIRSCTSACAAAQEACLWHKPTYQANSSKCVLPADLQEAASRQRAEAWSTGVTAIAPSGSFTQRLSRASVSSGRTTRSSARQATWSGLHAASVPSDLPSSRSNPASASVAAAASSSVWSRRAAQKTMMQITATVTSADLVVRCTPIAPTSGSSSSWAPSSSKCNALRTRTVIIVNASCGKRLQ